MPDHAATVELRHPRGAVTITVTSASPELAAHVANTIREHFRPDPVADLLRSLGGPRPPRRPF